MSLPSDAKVRKSIPIFRGVMMYFPKTMAAVAKLSMIGNEQHNPGEPLHWARDKSTDQHDTLARHLLEVGTLDSDRVPHDVKVAWRAWAACEEYLEQNPWDESVEDILNFIREQKARSTDDTVEEALHMWRDCCYAVQFTNGEGSVLRTTSFVGPFPTLDAAEKYARANPSDYKGYVSIHAINYPTEE